MVKMQGKVLVDQYYSTMWVTLPTLSRVQTSQVQKFLKFLNDKRYFFKSDFRGSICEITILLGCDQTDTDLHKKNLVNKIKKGEMMDYE